MVGFLSSAREERPTLAAELPHSLLLDAARGIVLLIQPRTESPRLSLGCAWGVTPRNMEVLDEQACLAIAQQHEHLLGLLPIGTDVQVLTTIVPSTELPAWEKAREAFAHHPVVQAQQVAIRKGLPHREGAATSHLRAFRTLVTLRLPLEEQAPELGAQLQNLLALPERPGAELASSLVAQQALTLERLLGLRAILEETLTLAGHTVKALDGVALGRQLALGLDPLNPLLPVIQAEEALAAQVCLEDAQNIAGGWCFGALGPDGTFTERWRTQVLSLHSSPPRTYPGMLTAPRAPEGATPMALWQVWDGPMTVALNIAAVDREKEKGHQQRKHWLAGLHNQKNIENQQLAQKLGTVLEGFMLAGDALQWGRLHVVLWGQEAALRQGVNRVIQHGQRVKLQFAPEPGMGSTLFLSTLPLGFDQTWPPEWALRRARRVEIKTLGQWFLGGGFQGTKTPGITYLNQRGEGIVYHPFDSDTNSHRITLGTSGAGKTHGVAYEVNQLMPLGVSIVIIDPLTRYRNLVATWKGTLHRIGFDQPPCFNPFYGDLSPRHTSFIAAFINQLASGGGEPLSWEEYNILSGALTYFAATWEPTRGEATLTPFIEEVLQDGCFDQKDAEAQRLGRQIARKLKLFYGQGSARGPYADFVDGPNTFTIDPGLTVIELYELENYLALKGILVFAMVYLIFEHFRDPARFYMPKFIKLDECWSLSNATQTAEQIHTIVRTGRNNGISVDFISHTGDDFDTRIGGVIRAIAGSTLFLKQEHGELPKLQRLFQLSDAEVALVRQSSKHEDYSTGYLRMGSQEGGQIKLVSDRFTTLQMSQDPLIAQRRDRAVAAANGDMYQALLAMLADEEAA